MKLVLIFGVIVAVGSLLVAGPILAGRLIDRGRRAYAILLLLPPLATFGMGVGNVGGGCLSIFLFGFDIDGRRHGGTDTCRPPGPQPDSCWVR